MSRKNHMRRPKGRRIDHYYDTDVCFLPQRPQLRLIIAAPLKTVYRNVEAAPWATEATLVTSIDDPLLRMIESRRWGA